MTAARLAPLERGIERGARGEQRGFQIERVREILIACEIGMDPHMRHLRVDLLELRQTCQDSLLVAYHSGVFGHHVADRALKPAHVLRSVGVQQLVHFRARAGHRFGRTLLRARARRIFGGSFAHDPTVHEQLDQRVPAEPVRAVQPARRFADGVQPLHTRAVVLGAHPHAAHRVVCGGRDFHGCGGDVQELQLHQRVVHAWQPLHDRLARKMRDIQQHASARRAAARLDLGVARERNAVACGELHPLGVVALHETLAERVAEDAALAARCLRHERTGRVHRLEEAGRMELHELRIADTAAGLHGETERVPGILVAARRAVAPEPGMAAGCEDDGVRVDHAACSIFDVEAVRAEDHVVADEQSGDVGRIEDRDTELHGTVHQRPLDLQAGVVAGERGAAPGVRAEESL